LLGTGSHGFVENAKARDHRRRKRTDDRSHSAAVALRDNNLEVFLQIVSLPISELCLDPANANVHDKKNLDAIKGSLAKFGQQKPIVINQKKVVIAGNGTLTAAIELGWSHIDCVTSDLSGTEQIAFALADNRTSELSKWDKEILGQTLQSLREEDFDVSSIGFDLSELDKIYGEPKNIKGSKELKEADFSNFDHKCPKCGFEFDK
jgi:hypothetical protein